MRLCLSRCLFVLLIALLPLRGWAVATLATDMAWGAIQAQQHAVVAPPAAAQTVASHHGANSAHGAHHAHDLALADDQPASAHGCHETADGAQPSSHDGGCSNCQVCQACHTMGLTAGAAQLPALPRPASPLPWAVASFASATAALEQKPPIS